VDNSFETDPESKQKNIFKDDNSIMRK